MFLIARIHSGKVASWCMNMYLANIEVGMLGTSRAYMLSHKITYYPLAAGTPFPQGIYVSFVEVISIKSSLACNKTSPPPKTKKEPQKDDAFFERALLFQGAYSSSHNHGSGEWVPPRLVSLYNRAILHFHDYGRKGKTSSRL